MRTHTLCTAAGRALATLGVLAALAAPRALAQEAASPPPAAEAPAAAMAPATETAPAPAAPAPDRIAEAKLEAGYRTVDVQDNRSLLFPYDPLTDGPVFDLELLYLTPGFGALRLEAGYLSGKSWRADVEYNRGADLAVRAGSEAFTHAREHLAPVAPVDVYVSPVYGSIEVEGKDADPGREYQDEFRETTAAAKVRAPGYPAHLSASGRIFRRQGVQQLPTFFRSCSAHACHVNSQSRELDQETREYTLGVDAHAGPFDLAYGHTARTYRDAAADPLVAVGDVSGGLPAGTYPHDVNPDQSSSTDTFKLNTNLTNRVVLSAVYTDGEQENEASDLSRRVRTAGGTLSWRAAPAVLLVGRYTYDEERTGDVGAGAQALRARRSAAHATLGHDHAPDPERTRHNAELAAGFTPLRHLDLNARVRYRSLERRAIYEKEGASFVAEPTTTTSTLAGLDARYRAGDALAFDGTLAREWTDGAVYAVETTGILRYGLGATWTPGPGLLARAAWQGFRGRNDDPDALQHAYAAAVPGDPGLERTVSGDAWTLSASYAPADAFSLSASWSLTDNGVEQDMLFGSAANPGYWYLSENTDWSGRNQLATLRARWEAGRRLTLTAEGTWIESLESYAPTFEEGAGLEEISRVEFTKLYASLEAQVRVTDALGVTLTAFWSSYDDQDDEAGDGEVTGVLAAVDVRW